jgi:hypothetical protein
MAVPVWHGLLSVAFFKGRQWTWLLDEKQHTVPSWLLDQIRDQENNTVFLEFFHEPKTSHKLRDSHDSDVEDVAWNLLTPLCRLATTKELEEDRATIMLAVERAAKLVAAEGRSNAVNAEEAPCAAVMIRALSQWVVAPTRL